MPLKLLHPYFLKLRELALPPGDFAVFGSGPLYAHGLISDLSDIDIIARGLAWQQALRLGQTSPTSSGDLKAVLAGGAIEAYYRWAPGEWDVNRLIDEADVIEGVRFVRLEEVLKWKKTMNRPKDGRHIFLLERHLAGRG